MISVDVTFLHNPPSFESSTMPGTADQRKSVGPKVVDEQRGGGIRRAFEEAAASLGRKKYEVFSHQDGWSLARQRPLGRILLDHHLQNLHDLLLLRDRLGIGDGPGIR